MGYRVEVWDRPGAAGFAHRDTVGYMRATMTRRGSGLGEGGLGVAADLDVVRLNRILFGDASAPANAVTALVRIYRDGDVSGSDTPFFEWIADQRIPPPAVAQPELSVSGLDINQIPGWASCEAYDWDGSVSWQSQFPDWVWGGRNALGDLVGRYLPERVTLSLLRVDDGTYTITVTNDAGSDTTSALAFDAGTVVIDNALTALTNVTFVDVAGAFPEYTLTFNDPNNNTIVAANSSSLVGQWQLAVNATGGTFTVTIDGNTSGNIAYNATAAALKTAIEAVTGITTVTVTKDVSTDPNHEWVVAFDVPESVATFTANAGGLTGGASTAVPTQLDPLAQISTVQQGRVVPAGWEPSMSYLSDFEHGTLVQLRMWETGDPALPAGCSNAIMFHGLEPDYPGIQKRVRVKPGGIYQVSAWITSSRTGDTVRLVVRDLAENELNGSSQDEQVIATAGTFQQFTIPNLVIPTDVEEVVFRVGHVDVPGIFPGLIWVACPEMNEGLAPTTVGDIFSVLYDDAQVDHVADGRQVWGAPAFLELDFDAVNDSNGNAWAESDVSVRFPMNTGYALVLTEFAGRGYEWRVIPKQQSTSNPADDGVWLLQLFNPTTAGTVLTGQSDPAIISGTDVIARAARMFAPHASHIRVQGPNGVTSRATSTDAQTAVGRRELGHQAPDLLSLASAVSVASAQLSDALSAAESISPTVRPVPGVDPIPGVDFDVFDTLNVGDVPYVSKSARRCAAWTATVTPDIPNGEFLLSFTAESFVGSSGINAAVRRLLREFKAIRPDEVGGGAGRIGEGQAQTTPHSCDVCGWPDVGQPTIAAGCTSYTDTASTHDWLIPPNATVGALVVAFLNIDHFSNTVSSVPSGWTLLGSGSGVGNSYVYARKLDGSENYNDTWTTTESDKATGQWLFVADYQGVVADIDFNSVIGGVDPPAVTASVPGDHIVITAMLCNKGGAGLVPADDVPAGYTFHCYEGFKATSANNPRIYTASRLVDIATNEDPGTFTYNDGGAGGRHFYLVTLAIPAAPLNPASAPFDHTHTEDQVDDIDTLTQKATPVDADRVKIYDSEDDDTFKFAELGDLPGGGGGGVATVRGTAQIDDPDTDVTVLHGLGSIPFRGQLQVTPRDTTDGWLDGAASAKLAVGDVDASSFKVLVDAAPGTGKHAAFDWLYVAAPPVAFDPDGIGGLVVWLDASQITGLSDTDPVENWENLAETETYTQATLANRPLYRTNILNSLPAVRFDGSNDHLDGSVSRTLKPMTAFVVLNWSGSDGRFIVGNVSNNSALVSRVLTSKFNFHTEGVSGLNPLSTTSVPNGTASLWDYSYGPTGAYLFGFNGVDDGSGTDNRTINATAVCIGARDSGSLFWHGDIHEILVYDSVLGATARQAVREYLLDKWGI